VIGGPWIGLSIHPGHVQVVTERVRSHHTVPYGTDAIGAFPGTSCQDFGELSRVATFTLSLRDDSFSRDNSDLLREYLQESFWFSDGIEK
jgi:hypothetical protein